MESQDLNFLNSLPRLAEQLSANVASIFEPYSSMGTGLRETLIQDGRIHDYGAVDTVVPESLGAVDGARITTNMYAGDFMTAVACSANGATGQNMRNNISDGWATVRLHEHGNDALAETAMGALESHVAHQSTHQIRLLDGSFRTPLIGMQKSLFSHSQSIQAEGANILTTPGWTHFDGLKSLYSYNADRPVIALPKSNTDRSHASYYASVYGGPMIEQDRVFASLVLRPGELLTPLAMQVRAAGHDVSRNNSAQMREAVTNLKECDNILSTLSKNMLLYATYFKPEHFSTVVRIEFVTSSSDVDEVQHVAEKYASIVNAEMVSRQPGSLEPFAQWNVDQEAKNAIKHMNELLRDRIIRSLTSEEMAAYGSLIIQNYRS